jgi:hypothetical protein
MVEILKARYGCTEGQRLRVASDAKQQWRLDPGNLIPKNQRNKTWKWLTEEEAALTNRSGAVATLVARAAAATALGKERGLSEPPRQAATLVARAAATTALGKERGLSEPPRQVPQFATVTGPASPAEGSMTASVEELSNRFLDQLMALPPGQKAEAWKEVISQFKRRLPVQLKTRWLMPSPAAAKSVASAHLLLVEASQHRWQRSPRQGIDLLCGAFQFQRLPGWMR